MTDFSVFSLMTSVYVHAANYPFRTIEFNIVIVNLSDSGLGNMDCVDRSGQGNRTEVYGYI